MSNPVHGRPPNNSGSAGSSSSSSSSSSSCSPSAASSPVSVNMQQPAGNNTLSGGGGVLKEKVGLPPVYLNLNEHAGKDLASGQQASCSPLQHWDDARTADVWLSSLHSVIFIITCALAAFILFRNVLTW